MRRERTAQAQKTLPPEQAGNSEGETGESRASRASETRRVGAEGTVAGEYLFRNRRVRTIAEGGETWFFATDVCEVLEHTNPR